MTKRKMTRAQAVEKLRTTRQLSTDLLAPLGISFESWLQVPAAAMPAIIEKILAREGVT